MCIALVCGVANITSDVKPKTDAKQPELHYVCPKERAHRVWGIYRHRGEGRVFYLVTMISDYDESIVRAKSLKGGFPDADFSIQGAEDSAALPERYDG